MYVLAFQLPEAASLERIHGPVVSDLVRQDVAEAFREIAGDLLHHHEALSGVLSPEFGTWLVPFEMGRPEIELEPREQCGAITQAAKGLVRRMLQDQLGMGVAVRTEFRVAVIETVPAVLDGDLLLERLRGQLEGLPRSAFAQPKIRRAEFMEIIHGGRIDLHLQPILSLEPERIVGFEALARGPEGSAVREAGPLFGAAAYFGMEAELDLACVASALEWAPRIPKPYWLSINMSPELLTQATLQRLIDAQADASLFERQVFELTEHLPIHSSLKVHRAVAPFRERGARLAIDDAGSGFFNMETIRALQPDIVKIAMTIVRRIDEPDGTADSVRALVRKVQEAGAVALGEGVERRSQADALKACGVRLAQGFMWSKPRPAAQVLADL